MSKYKLQRKKADGTMEDLDIQAKYDGNGNDIASTYVAKTQTATSSNAGLVCVSSVNSSKVTVNTESNTSGRYYPIELNSDGKAIVNVPWTGWISVVCYGTCSIGGSTAAKTVTPTSGTFNLEAGAQIIVKFRYKNTASNPTLNVNSSGAKSIYFNGSIIGTGDTKNILKWAVNFIYDGSYYHIVSSSLVDSGYTQNNILPTAKNSYILGSASYPFSQVNSAKVNTNKLNLATISSNSLNSTSYDAFGEVLWSGTKTTTGEISLTSGSPYFNYYMLVGYNNNTEYNTIMVPYDAFYNKKVFLISSGSSLRYAVVQLTAATTANITAIQTFTLTKIIGLGGPRA